MPPRGRFSEALSQGPSAAREAEEGPALSRGQAWQLQEELLQAFSADSFQTELQKRWFGTSIKAERQRLRTELCLPIQCRAVAKFGFEASRRGVFLSARALEAPELKADAQLKERSAKLAQLVEPEVHQPSQVQGQPAPPNNAPGNIEYDLKLIVSRLTPHEKIAQMLQLERLVAPQDELCGIIMQHSVGSILSGGGSAPDPNTPEQWADMIDAFQRSAIAARSKLPILYGNDSVHGQSNCVGAVLFPHNIGLGCAGDPEIARRCAEITAVESRATGVHWVFAPALSVVQDIRWGRSYESFGNDFDLVTRLGVAATKGYQANHTVACIKHWIGDGATDFCSGSHAFDQGNCRLSEAELRATHMKPYVACLRAGCQTVMASFSSVGGVKMHGHKHLLTGVLKQELGFDGIVVSDWAAIDQLAPKDHFQQALVTAINAGIDMVMLPGVVSSGHHSYIDYFQLMHEAVQKGLISPERIDDAVARIARTKMRAGLMQSPFARREDLSRVGCREHRQAAREAVRRSQVLLKNNGALPLRKHSQVLLAGSCADDLGRQCGGWSIWHQGFWGNDDTEGTTIREGLDEVGIRFCFDAMAFDNSFLSRCDVAVVVCGERPYAEMDGDRTDYTDIWDVSEYEMVHRLRNLNEHMQVVLVLICGRPVPLYDDILDLADAILVSWLPGTEGGGVADVLSGRCSPTGRLTVRWPSATDGWHHALFERGHGLSYSTRQ